MPHLQARGEVHRGRDRETDERCHCRIPPALAEKRRFESRVRPLEGLVVPVETAARLGGQDEQAEQHGSEECVVLGRARPCVGLREDRRRRLARELLERETGVLPPAQEGLAVLDEAADERAQLVERRPAALEVLLEGERKVRALLELTAEHDERAEDETAEERVEMGSAHGHGFPYAAGGTSPLRSARSMDEGGIIAVSIFFGAVTGRWWSVVLAAPAGLLAASAFEFEGFSRTEVAVLTGLVVAAGLAVGVAARRAVTALLRSR